MPFNIGPFELILVLVIVLILFGPGKLPDIGNAIGKGVREFRKASSDLEDSIRGEVTQAVEPAAKPAQSETTPAQSATTPAQPVENKEQQAVASSGSSSSDATSEPK